MARRLGSSGAASGRHRRSNLMPTFHEWLSAVGATPLVGEGIEPPGGLTLIVVLIGVGVLFVWLMNRGWPGPLVAGLRAHEAGRHAEAEQHLLRALREAEGLAPD